jgi:hypothetical protein
VATCVSAIRRQLQLVKLISKNTSLKILQCCAFVGEKNFNIIKMHGTTIIKKYHWFCHVCLSVRTEQLGSHLTDFHKICYLNIFRKKLSKKYKFLKIGKNNGTLHSDQYGPTYFIISRSVLLTMENISGNSFRENQNTHFMLSNFFFSNRTVCETMWKNTVQPDRPQIKIWLMGISFWIPKATNTHSKNVILISFHHNNGYTNAPQYYDVRTVDCLYLRESVTFTAPLDSPVTKLAFFRLVKLRAVFVGSFLVLSPPGGEHKLPEFSCCALYLERSLLLLGWQYVCLLPKPILRQCNRSELHKYRGIY